jgi:hypothetical protein
LSVFFQDGRERLELEFKKIDNRSGTAFPEKSFLPWAAFGK